MSEPQAEREAMDVLSSIRRLVSEDRRVKPAPLADRVEPVLTPPVPTLDADYAAQSPREEVSGSRLPAESRFVLTAALRVDSDSDSRDSEIESDWSAEEATVVAPDLELTPPSSLEATIAELEAAVAGIDADFEPDGGEHTPDDTSEDLAPAWIAPQAPTRSAEAYHGIIAGFDGLSPVDDRLDLPIAGDADLALPPHAADWRSATTRENMKAERSGYVAAAFHHIPVTLPLGLLPEASVDSPTDSGRSEPLIEEAAAAAVSNPGDEVPTDLEIDKVATRDEIDDGAKVASGAEAHIGASRPTIFRHSQDAEDAASEEEPSLTADNLVAGVDEEGDDLFDPLAGSDLDMAALRDLVAEIVRDELRGTLGERITRNLRALVRREIARALEAEGLTGN